LADPLLGMGVGVYIFRRPSYQLLPALFQQFIVVPSELAFETSYLQDARALAAGRA
jgi:hypothetical protein